MNPTYLKTSVEVIRGYHTSEKTIKTTQELLEQLGKEAIHVLYESYQDAKFRCCPLLKKMVDAGLLGVKSGKGFYEYH